MSPSVRRVEPPCPICASFPRSFWIPSHLVFLTVHRWRYRRGWRSWSHRSPFQDLLQGATASLLRSTLKADSLPRALSPPPSAKRRDTSPASAPPTRLLSSSKRLVRDGRRDEVVEFDSHSRIAVSTLAPAAEERLAALPLVAYKSLLPGRYTISATFQQNEREKRTSSRTSSQTASAKQPPPSPPNPQRCLRRTTSLRLGRSSQRGRRRRGKTH